MESTSFFHEKPFVPPFISPNSFEHKLDDYQNIPEVQKFMDDEWNEADNTIKYVPTFRFRDETKLKMKLITSKDWAKIVDKIELQTKAIGTNKIFGAKLSSDEIELHLDAGFRRSLVYNFNPFYKVKFNRVGGDLKQIIAGLNYNAPDMCTHHEVSLVKDDSYWGVRFRNAALMKWRFLKCYSINSITYGKRVVSSSSHVVSAHLINQVAIFGIYNQLENDEKNYNIGFRATIDPMLTLFGGVHINPFFHFHHFAGASFDVSKADISGKVCLADFTQLSLHLKKKLPYGINASITMKGDFSGEAGKPQGISNNIQAGIKIEQDF